MKSLITFATLLILTFQISINPQNDSDTLLKSSTFSGLKFRSIGPAFMSGRIADIVVHPEDDSYWYVAVGSGGVWKTTNSGTTWNPIFDDQSSYSIGCVTIDPNNSSIVWVGTGENVGGRHVGYGDGVYKSEDEGNTWKNMGLKESQHISEIIIHPENSNIIWVAAQGPLWNKGDERGLYKSTDGGNTWVKKLGDSEWVGVTDIAIDPRNPDWLYAVTWQRHRNVASYMGGGPGTGIHKSTDCGETWAKLKNGLPTSNWGKTSIAVSPQKPDVIYAAIELDRRKGGVYKSVNRGATWEKQSDAVSGATGPHYYQELYASPHKFDRIYLVDVRMQISEDGGKTFQRMKESHKHSDNHAIVFKKDDPDYLLVGTDGGIYESFDLAENWRFISNLPLTQFYKVAVDDAKPFYNIYGGTQDNNTQGGPSRTDNRHGIRNSDWFITLYADGHQPATEPGNPDIVYSEWQEGNLVRHDRKTGEIVHIQPQPEVGEGYERFNWDAPILVSPHLPTRLYYASHRVWKSENRGDSWTAISPDLTMNQERINLPIMEQTWSWDAQWDVYAMSMYNTITSLAESPVKEGIIYAGTDDGLIQVTEDGGTNWRKIDVGSLPGVPETAFVNDIKADLYEVNTAYIVLDNHKFGDLNPYVLKTTDLGKSWKSIRANLPERQLLWRIVQDHINPALFFLATEFGIYFTIDNGENWVQLKGGVPTISFRDLAIQKRENDLVGASFGRSFYVLDDYSVLRDVSKEQLQQGTKLFSVKDAWWYIPRPVLSYSEKGAQGAGFFTSPNPPFGAVFTYYLKDALKTRQDIRKEKEKELIKNKKNVTFPGWDEVESERREEQPVIWLTVSDEAGNVIRRIKGEVTKGFHRIAWDLSFASSYAIDVKDELKEEIPSGVMVTPGTYSVTLSKQVDGINTFLSGPESFNVVKMREGTLKGSTPVETANFWKEIADIQRSVSAVTLSIQNALKKVDALKIALSRTSSAPGNLDFEIHNLKQNLFELDERLNGNKSKDEIGEHIPPTIIRRINVATNGTFYSTYGPTPTHRRSLEIAKTELAELKKGLEVLINVDMNRIEKSLIDAGAPWIE
ncbi:glycosyl hydrolase [Bacteroidota bacterium]